jgi:hypothetical protein
LSERGYDVAGFGGSVNTRAWLEEETPELAIIEGQRILFMST